MTHKIILGVIDRNVTRLNLRMRMPFGHAATGLGRSDFSVLIITTEFAGWPTLCVIISTSPTPC